MTNVDTALPVFPPDFVWGASTAAYQIEGGAADGGRGPSIWDTFSHTPGRVRGGDTGDVAADHYHRWAQDVALLADLGVTAYRFSIAWPRILPAGRGPVNEEGLDFYRRLVDALLGCGIRPVPTLYHWDLPQALEDLGGWRNRDSAGWFADYANVLFAALGDRVPLWTTLNEPFGPSFAGYANGNHAPGLRLGAGALAAAHHLLLAHGRAVEVYRAGGATGRIGITLDFAQIAPGGPDAADVAAATRLDTLRNRWFADALFTGAYPTELVRYYAAITDFGFVREGDLALGGVDFLGVNYYNSWLASAVPPAPPGRRTADDVGAAVTAPPGAELTGYGWPVTPDDLTGLLTALRDRYPGLPPLYLTENGCAYPDRPDGHGRVADPARIAYLDRYVRAAAEARRAGVDLRGYFVWSLLDNFEWADGYSQRFGLVHVDFATGHRTPKDSFRWYQRLINRCTDPEENP